MGTGLNLFGLGFVSFFCQNSLTYKIVFFEVLLLITQRSLAFVVSLHVPIGQVQRWHPINVLWVKLFAWSAFCNWQIVELDFNKLKISWSHLSAVCWSTSPSSPWILNFGLEHRTCSSIGLFTKRVSTARRVHLQKYLKGYLIVLKSMN